MAVGVFGMAAICFGLSRDYWLSFACLLVLGAALVAAFAFSLLRSRPPA